MLAAPPPPGFGPSLGARPFSAAPLVVLVMERYTKGDAVGEGTFGVVYRATRNVDGRVVAIKKIRLGAAREGVNVTALREIKMLRVWKSTAACRSHGGRHKPRGCHAALWRLAHAARASRAPRRHRPPSYRRHQDRLRV